MRNQKGFTLVELLVVVAIIAILATIGLTIYNGVQKGSRDSKRKADIQSISDALEAHITTKAGPDACVVGAAGPSINSGTYCIPAADWFANGIVPVDPSTGTGYLITQNDAPTYSALVDGSATYRICTQAAQALETTGASFCLTNRQ